MICIVILKSFDVIGHHFSLQLRASFIVKPSTYAKAMADKSTLLIFSKSIPILLLGGASRRSIVVLEGRSINPSGLSRTAID